MPSPHRDGTLEQGVRGTMMKRLLALLAAITVPLLSPLHAQVAQTAKVVSACSAQSYTAGTNNYITVKTTGDLCSGGGAVPVGTADINLKQVNGQTVNVGTGAAGTGTQRVTTSTDSSVNVVPTGTNITITPTIQNAQYVSGNCMGGFQTVALGTAASVLNQVNLLSKGGLATAKQIYLFSANPSGSTCTDKSTFTLAAADVSKVMSIFSLTPAAPTGTTVTFAAQTSVGLGVPSGGTIYAAVVDTATETPGSTSDLVLNFSAF